jgi:hypothetical protein
MSNIEYYGIQYLPDSERKHYRRVQRNRAKYLAERFEKNSEVIAAAEDAERLDQETAIDSYRKLRSERKYRDNMFMLKNIHNIFLP